MKATRTLAVPMAVLAAAAATASERRVTLDELPAAVQETVRERTRGQKLLALSEEIEDGQTLYEAEVRIDGRTREIVIDASGKVVEEEMEVPLDSVPEAARAALQQAADGGTMGKVEAVTKDGVTVYEAKIKKDGKKTEVVVDADGTIQKQ